MLNNALLLPLAASSIIVERDTVSMSRPNDTPIERLTMEVNAIAVQVIRYDGDDSCVSVAIGGPFGSIDSMPADEVAGYIERMTGSA